MRGRFSIVAISVAIGAVLALVGPRFGAVGQYSGEPSPTPPPPGQRNLTIDDVKQKEGDSKDKAFDFTVTLSQPSPVVVSAAYATADGKAKAPKDYMEASGTVNFAPGQTQQIITVLVKGDRKPERNEKFTVELSNAQNARIEDGTGTGTIKNDDGKRRRGRRR